MSQETIKCPMCSFEIKLSDALSKDIEAGIKAKYEASARELEKDLRMKIQKDLEKKNSSELEDLRASLEEREKDLEESKANELQLRKERRELEEQKKNLALEVERTLDRERQTIADKAAREAEEAHKYKDAEKDEKLSKMLEQIEELKRKAEQGSQKIQGEVLEVELEALLKSEFPFDSIEEVAPGVRGGDILQIVKTRSGKECGKILWELKRTRAFSESWLAKLRSDARACKVDLCLLVSETLPEGMEIFGEMEGVWVSSIKSCVPLAMTLRQTLEKVQHERSAQVGKQSKAELVYEYMMGSEFRGRVEAIIEAFRSMKDDLETERKAMEKIWSKREKQIGQVVLNLAGLHGDLEGVAGNALPVVKALELK